MTVFFTCIRLWHGFLALPFVAVLAPIPFLYGVPFHILGLPVLLLWLFFCLPLTALCLAVSAMLRARETEQ